jgi:hypothetical protein
MTVFFSLIIAILLSSFSTIVTSSNIDINDNYVDSSSSVEEAGNVKADRQHSESITSLVTSTLVTATIKIMDPINNLRGILKQSTGTRSQIFIVLAYRESCEKSMELLWRLRHYAVPKIEFSDDSVFDEDLHPTITLVPMPVDDDEDDVANDDSNENILNRLGIVRLPSLFFLLDEEREELSIASSKILSEENENHNDNDNSVNILANAQVYHGLSETVDDLVNGLYFYLTRLRLRSHHKHKHKQRQSLYQNLPLTTIQVESLRELRTIISNSDGMILQNTQLPLDPDLSKDEDRWIRYMMDDTHSGSYSMFSTKNDYIYGGDLEGNKEDDEAGRRQQQQRTTITTDSFRVVVQCRKKIRNSQMKSASESYQEFDRVAKVLGAKRDVLFSLLEWDDDDNVDLDADDRNSSVSFCNFRDDDDDGLVAVWEWDGDRSLLAEGFGEPPFSVMSTTTTIVDGLSIWLRPNLLWFDRRFASIAFHPRYRRHAVLFVDFHDRTSATKMRETIRIFRNECRRRRRNIDAETDDTIIFCLVVPVSE